MGTYAKVYLKYKGDETLERHDSWIDGDFGAIQCYCAFAVLGNVRNEHRLVPLFDNVESTLREEVKRVAASELYDYFVGPCFTLEEWRQLNLDRPLEFKDGSNPLSPALTRGDSVISYREFIQNETPIFEWIKRLEENNVEAVGFVFV